MYLLGKKFLLHYTSSSSSLSLAAAVLSCLSHYQRYSTMDKRHTPHTAEFAPQDIRRSLTWPRKYARILLDRACGTVPSQRGSHNRYGFSCDFVTPISRGDSPFCSDEE